MIDETRRIHWLAIDKPQVLSKLLKKDGHDIAWEVKRTGRIGFRFRTDHNGIACIEVYEELSYTINTNVPKLRTPQLRIDDAREVKLIGTLFPGLDPEAGEKEKLIREITEDAADNKLTDGAAFLWRILLWAVNHDINLLDAAKSRYPQWAEGAKESIETAGL